MRNFIRSTQHWVALLGAIMLACWLATNYSDPKVNLTHAPPPAPTYTLCQTSAPDGSTLGRKADGTWWYFDGKDLPGTYPACPDEAYVNPVPSATENGARP